MKALRVDADGDAIDLILVEEDGLHERPLFTLDGYSAAALAQELVLALPVTYLRESQGTAARVEVLQRSLERLVAYAADKGEESEA